MKRLLLPILCLISLPLVAQSPREEALSFLYRYMPLPDRVDYTRDFWEQNVDASLLARQEMPWGQSVPEREWRHFVLPVRVNNEDLDLSRPVFYEALKSRVAHLSMAEAVLEVNHWCHEWVTYQPSDIRTSAPLATMQSGRGRCGEESTFCVAALRSVGIPARQVYTPRWAHTDDNHAWVEVWVDGQWHFLGACEPEPVLDLGWFNAPASRAMLMHTKAFGHYDGPEEVMSRTPCYTEIDVTDHYAPTRRFHVVTLDREGRPIPATVHFKLYNYAEFYTLSTRQSDDQGYCSMRAGCGDLVVWATDGQHYGVGKSTAQERDTLYLRLEHQAGSPMAMDLDLTPPAERNTIPALTDEQVAYNRQRLAIEDSLRTARLGKLAQRARGDSLLLRTRSNVYNVEAFLTGAVDRASALRLLHAITDKDLRDVPLEVLQDHYIYTPRTAYPDSIFTPYVLCPRVSNERLTPYKSFFTQTIPTDLQEACRREPRQWTQWVNSHITLSLEDNPQHLCMSPRGVWEHRTTDPHSRDIFWVSAARAMGIAARIDEVSGKVQWWDSEGAVWQDVNFENAQLGTVPKGTLQLLYQGSVPQDPRYYSHFTLSLLEQGLPTLLSYPEEGVTARGTFALGEPLDVGTYALVTGTRLAGGGVLAHLQTLDIQAGDTVSCPLVLRQDSQQLTVIGNLDSEAHYMDDSEGDRSILSTTGRGYYVLGIVAPGQEPSNHALRDIVAVGEELQQVGRPMVLLTEEENWHIRQDYPRLPLVCHTGRDNEGAILGALRQAMPQMSQALPVFVIADTFNRVVWLQQGYTIGLGERLHQLLTRLQQ